MFTAKVPNWWTWVQLGRMPGCGLPHTFISCRRRVHWSKKGSGGRDFYFFHLFLQYSSATHTSLVRENIYSEVKHFQKMENLFLSPHKHNFDEHNEDMTFRPQFQPCLQICKFWTGNTVVSVYLVFKLHMLHNA